MCVSEGEWRVDLGFGRYDQARPTRPVSPCHPPPCLPFTPLPFCPPRRTLLQIPLRLTPPTAHSCDLPTALMLRHSRTQPQMWPQVSNPSRDFSHTTFPSGLSADMCNRPVVSSSRNMYLGQLFRWFEVFRVFRRHKNYMARCMPNFKQE